MRGITRLQKLLFVIEQTLASQSQFYAFNYGPFNEEVNDAARALEVAGFTRSAEPVASGPPSFQEMIAAATERAAPEDEGTVVEFALNDRGHESAETLRQSNPSYEQLFKLVESVRRDWDTGDLNELIERVYENLAEVCREVRHSRKGRSADRTPAYSMTASRAPCK